MRNDRREAEEDIVRVRIIPASLIAASLLALPNAASAQAQRPSLADSFRLGNGGGVLCQVQTKSRDGGAPWNNCSSNSDNCELK